MQAQIIKKLIRLAGPIAGQLIVILLGSLWESRAKLLNR